MPSSKPYHHGRLREALLEAATRLVSEVGPAGFTLREVARRAGVSHNAPYRHFRDRDALLAAVAAQGFRELAQEMEKGAKAEPSPLGRLRGSGLAYVSFALRRPAHFTVMFDAPMAGGMTRGRHRDLADASAHAFSALTGLIQSCQQAGQLPSGSARERTLYAWSLVHGIAKLAVAGRLPYRSPRAILKFARFVIEQSLPDDVSGRADRAPVDGRQNAGRRPGWPREASGEALSRDRPRRTM